MPIIKSAIKRMRQTTKRRVRNVVRKRHLKSAVKAFTAKPGAATLSAAQSELDRMVKKNLLPKNTAARRKAQLVRLAKEAGVKPRASKKAAPKTAKAPASKPAAAKKPAAKKPAATKTKPNAAKKATKPSKKSS